MNKLFGIIIDKNYDRSFGVGLEVYTHKHMTKTPRHIHILIILGFWFFELQIGNDAPSEPEN